MTKGVTDIPTPECAKLSKVAKDSQKIGEFLDWLGVVRNVTLAEYRYDDDDLECLVPLMVPMETLLAEYFAIDLAKVEREKVAILDAVRAAHAAEGR